MSSRRGSESTASHRAAVCCHWASLLVGLLAVGVEVEGLAVPVQLPSNYRLGRPLLSQLGGFDNLPASAAVRLTLAHDPTPSDTHAESNGDSLVRRAVGEPADLYFCDPRQTYRSVGRTVVVAPTFSVWSATAGNPTFLRNALGSNAASASSIFLGPGGLSICGSLGLQYTTNASAPVALSPPTSEGRVGASILVEVITEGDGYLSAIVNATQTFGVLAGTAVAAEVSPGSVWCGGATEGQVFLAPKTMLTATVGVVLPELVLVLFDSWGNPATNDGDASFAGITVATEPGTVPSAERLLVGSGRATAIAATHVVVLTGLILNASATVRFSLAAPRSTSISDAGAVVLSAGSAMYDSGTLYRAGVYYYTLSVSMDGIQLGGRTASCRRFELAPGVPHSIHVEPLTDFEPTYDASYRPGFVVPRTDSLVVSLTVRDIFGNLLPPGRECGLSQPAGPFLNAYCLDCTSTGVMVVESRVAPVVASGVNTTSAFFRMSTPAIGWSQLTCSLNTTQSLYTLLTVVALQVVHHGEFSCYRGTESFEQLIDAKGLADVQAVFFDNSLRTPPMAKVELYIPFTSTPLLLPDLYTALGELTNIGPQYGYQDLEQDLFHWILIPRKGFVYIPLGLLSVMSFGASYTTVSSVVINVTKPICRDASPNQVRTAISQYLYHLGDNSTAWYRRHTPSTDPTLAVNINIQVCYGTGISELEFVSMYCCDRNAVCESAASQSPLGVILLSGGLGFSLIVSAVTCWFLWRTVNRTPVDVKPKQQLDIAEKTRVVMAHIFAPFVLWFHAYFIFGLGGISARFLFWMDILIAVLWYVVAGLRGALPLVVAVPSIYKASVSVVLFYTQFLMCNCAVWTLTALHLNMDMLPYLVASSLTVLQVFWSVQAAEAQLQPSILQEKVPPYSMAPVDAVLSLEYFSIAVMLLLFALTQQTELSSFGAFGATALVVAFSWFWNYSISAQFNDAVQRAFGKDATTTTVMEKVSQQVKKQQVQAAVVRADGAAREFGVALGDLGAPLLRSSSPNTDEQAAGNSPEAGREMTTVGKVIEKWKEAAVRRGSKLGEAAGTSLLSPDGRSVPSPHTSSFRRIPQQVQSLLASVSGQSSPADGPLRPQRRTHSQFSSADGTDHETASAAGVNADHQASESPSRSPTRRPSAPPATAGEEGEEFSAARLIARLAQSHMI